MRRALFSLCAAVGLMLGCCSQPHEIRAADSLLRHDCRGAKEKSRAELQRIVEEPPRTEYAMRAGARRDEPAYPVEQRASVGCRQDAE